MISIYRKATQSHTCMPSFPMHNSDLKSLQECDLQKKSQIKTKVMCLGRSWNF